MFYVNIKLNMFKYSIKMLPDMREHLQESDLKTRMFKQNHKTAGNGCIWMYRAVTCAGHAGNSEETQPRERTVSLLVYVSREVICTIHMHELRTYSCHIYEYLASLFTNLTSGALKWVHHLTQFW